MKDEADLPSLFGVLDTGYIGRFARPGLKARSNQPSPLKGAKRLFLYPY